MKVEDERMNYEMFWFKSYKAKIISTKKKKLFDLFRLEKFMSTIFITEWIWRKFSFLNVKLLLCNLRETFQIALKDFKQTNKRSSKENIVKVFFYRAFFSES